MEPLRTARLELRPFTLDDAEFLVVLLNEPGFLRFIGDKQARTAEQARGYLRDGPLASYERHGFGILAVCLGDGTPIGMCGLLKRDALDDVDIGFAFLEAFQGKGYAKEAAMAVLEDARERGVGRVVAITAPDNERSIGLLETLGFRFEGMVRLEPGAEESRLFGVRLGVE